MPSTQILRMDMRIQVLYWLKLFLCFRKDGYVFVYQRWLIGRS